MRRRITSAKREEIEKQQRALSLTIVRPFEVLSSLPLSYNPPPNGHYEDVLKNPLTTKDSGVLYRSLMKSRLNYMNVGPMFKLYWLKQSSYAKKMQQLEHDKPNSKSLKEDKSNDRVPILGNDVSARDVMVKLCDASLSLGPHKFEIRLFIAKDERSEKSNKKKDEGNVKLESSDKVESGNGPQQVSQGNETVDQNREKLSPSLPDKRNQETIQISVNTDKTSLELTNKDSKEHLIIPESSNKQQNEKIDDNATQTATKETQDNNNETSNNIDTKPSNALLEKGIDINNKSGSEDSKIEVEHQDKGESEESQDNTNHKSETNQTNTQGAIYDKDKVKELTGEEKREELPNKPVSSTNVSNDTPAPDTAQNQPPNTSNSQPQNLTPAPTVNSNPKSDPNYMQSIENTIMIANLNTIARVDQSLNALMKIVALGNASPQQIITFQGYIQRARDMGPQPHHAYLFPNGILPNQRLKKLKDKKPPKEKKQPKPKIPKDQKLTAFQEKYLTNATLLFEFVENANVRYMLPQEAICEVIPPESENNEEADCKDILVSFLWIHNQNELDEYDKKLKEYNEFEKKKKEEEEELLKKKLKEEEDLKSKEQIEKTEQPENQQGEHQGIDNNEESETKTETVPKPEEQTATTEPEEVQQTRRPPPRKGRKKRGVTGPNKKTAPKKIERPTEPEIRYTAISLTIHGIPSRYIPIIVNSFKKLEDVQERMSYILKNGVRTTSFYLWYQVDGKLDEAIAEEIRVQLNQEEKKMQGATATQSSTSVNAVKKRKQKDKLLDPKPKKPKSGISVPESGGQEVANGESIDKANNATISQ